MLERESVKTYKKNMADLEERQKKAVEDDEAQARQGKKEFIKRDRALQARANQDRELNDETIVHSLYSLEVKLKTGAERAKNWQNENIVGKAHNHVRRVEEVRSGSQTIGTSS